MSLPPMDFAERLARLRGSMAEAELPALVVSSLVNIRYLTGFTGSAALLFVVEGELVLLTDGRYATQAPQELEAAGVEARIEIAGAEEQKDRAISIVSGAAPARLALEAEHTSWARQIAWSETWFPRLELVATTGLVEALRLLKDAGEVARIEEAARIADEALASVRGLLSQGPTEAEVALALEVEMRRRGAAGPSFPTIVASGPNAAKPHHRAAGRRIEAGEPVVVDFGALFDGYCSDMTRTLWVGSLASSEVRRAVEAVAAAQAAGVAAVTSGAGAAEVDRTCRESLEGAGLGERFVHGTGHGVGLLVHEAPWLGRSSTDKLAAGNVVTVEPGVYLPGLGGARIEDTVVVTEDGCRPLTLSPKDMP